MRRMGMVGVVRVRCMRVRCVEMLVFLELSGDVTGFASITRFARNWAQPCDLRSRAQPGITHRSAIRQLEPTRLCNAGNHVWRRITAIGGLSWDCGEWR